MPDPLGSPNDTLAPATIGVLGLPPTTLEAAAMHRRVWLVLYQRTLDEAAKAGTVPASKAWLDQRYQGGLEQRIGDLRALSLPDGGLMTDANDPEVANTLPEARRAEGPRGARPADAAAVLCGGGGARPHPHRSRHLPRTRRPGVLPQVAENLAAGRGLTIDAIWGLPGALCRHHSPQQRILDAAALFGAWRRSSPSSEQLPAGPGHRRVRGGAAGSPHLVGGAGAYRPQGSWRGLAFFAALLVAVNPLLVYQSVTVDSSVYFSLLGASALLVATLPATTEQSGQRAVLSALAAGLLAGLAYLARSDGLYLVLLLLLWVWWTAPRDRRLPQAVAMAVGAGVVIAPWLLRNELTFGAPFPSPVQVLALVPDYPTLFHYDPSAFWDGVAAPGFGEQIALRWQGLSHNVYVLLVQSLFPIAIFGLLGFRYLRSAPVAKLGGLFGLMLLLVSGLAFPVLTMHGVFYHAVGAFIPFLTILSAYGLYRVGSS